jgi:hypothetical protein
LVKDRSPAWSRASVFVSGLIVSRVSRAQLAREVPSGASDLKVFLSQRLSSFREARNLFCRVPVSENRVSRETQILPLRGRMTTKKINSTRDDNEKNKLNKDDNKGK